MSCQRATNCSKAGATVIAVRGSRTGSSWRSTSRAAADSAATPRPTERTPAVSMSTAYMGLALLPSVVAPSIAPRRAALNSLSTAPVDNSCHGGSAGVDARAGTTWMGGREARHTSRGRSPVAFGYSRVGPWKLPASSAGDDACPAYD